MNFSIISHKSLLGKIARFPLNLIPPNTIMPVFQGKLRGKKWIVGSHFHGCWLGSYEYNKRIIFEKLVKEGSIVFDIGANVGFYTLLASVLVGPKGRVFAFEPVKRNFFFLKKHLLLNHIVNVSVIKAAVGDSSGTCFFDESSSSGEGHISTKGRIQVKLVNLDNLISKGEIPFPNYIKIDVEGAEMQVLSGARSMLKEIHPTIFLATHGRDIHSRCCNYLTCLGYTLESLRGNKLEDTDEILAYKKK